jgi:hypothetical protein
MQNELESSILGKECEAYMAKNIVISGFLGGVVMFAVMVASRLFLSGVLGTEFRSIPDQVPVHAAIKGRITEPGTYIFPYLAPNDRSTPLPDYLNEPIFEVRYKGYTHSTVPGFASAGMLSFLLAPMAAAWLLTQASDRVRATYFRRVVYVATLGLFIAVSSDLLRGLTDEQPFSAVAGMALMSIITWTLAGLILAWRIKPRLAGS